MGGDEKKRDRTVRQGGVNYRESDSTIFNLHTYHCRIFTHRVDDLALRHPMPCGAALVSLGLADNGFADGVVERLVVQPFEDEVVQGLGTLLSR